MALRIHRGHPAGPIYSARWTLHRSEIRLLHHRHVIVEEDLRAPGARDAKIEAQARSVECPTFVVRINRASVGDSAPIVDVKLPMLWSAFTHSVLTGDGPDRYDGLTDLTIVAEVGPLVPAKAGYLAHQIPEVPKLDPVKRRRPPLHPGPIPRSR